MIVSHVNHRYCGIRESPKIVAPSKAGLTTIYAQNEGLRLSYMGYAAALPALMADLTNDLYILQSLRVMIDYIKEAK